LSVALYRVSYGTVGIYFPWRMMMCDENGIIALII
jgi:hypothetical protein